MPSGSITRFVLRSAGLAAAAAEATASTRSLLLSQPSSTRHAQLPWIPLQQHATVLLHYGNRSFSSAQRKPAKKQHPQQHGSQQKPDRKYNRKHAAARQLYRANHHLQDVAWASRVASTALQLNRSSSPQQQQHQQQQEIKFAAVAACGSTPITRTPWSAGASASPAQPPTAAIDTTHRQSFSARLTEAGSATDDSEWTKPPKALGLADTAGGGHLCAPTPIDVGQLMALVKKASSIGDMEQLLLQHHSDFRSYHVAAAVVKLPSLQPDEALNTRRRMQRLTTLLASGLLTVGHQLDPHQTLACFKALTSPACLNPVQSAPLNRLMSNLVAEQGAGLRKLHSYELAQAAEAAAMTHLVGEQLAMLQQQQQQRQPEQCAQQVTEGTGSVNGMLGTHAVAPTTCHVVPAAAAAAAATTGSSAVALLSPLQQLWSLLVSVSMPQLDSFSAASLSLLAFSCARAGKANNELMLSIGHAALGKHHKFDSPGVVVQLLQALALSSGSNQQQLLGVLAAAVVQYKAQFSPRQLADTAAALVQLGFYSEAACLAICKVASRSLKHWTAGDVATLLSALARLRFRDELLLKAVVKQLPIKVASGQLPGSQMADVLAAMVQLSYTAPDMEKLVVACFSQVGHMPGELTPAAAIKLLWVSAVLEQGGGKLQQLLLSRLSDVKPKQLNQHLLRMLYQAHRLMTHEWLQVEGEAGSALADDVDDSDEYCVGIEGPSFDDQPTTPFVVVFGDDSSSNAAEESAAEATSQHQQRLQWQGVSLAGGFAMHDIREPDISSNSTWPARLVTAARSAAALHAGTSAARSKQQQPHVQDLFEGLGYEAPVKGLKLDGGALQPDLAWIAADRKQSKQQLPGCNMNTSASDMKVAVMCDHAGRYSRNAPYQLLGYDTVSGWLLEQCGWKVVRLPPHEWRLLLSDRGVDEGTALAVLHNSLASQGVPL